jgi:ATP-dependent DNA helicase RecQ
LTLFDAADIRLRRMQIAQSAAADAQKAIDRKWLDALVDLCESERCRRQNLLGYFGESAPPCGNCDICLEPRRWWRALLRFGRSRKALKPGP